MNTPKKAANSDKVSQKRKKRDVRNKLRMPVFEAISQNEIVLKSFTGVTATLFDAVQDSWEMCKNCGQFYTPAEYADVHKNDDFCSSEICKPKYEKYAPIELPVERLSIYANMLSTDKFTESLIYHIFYEIDDMKLHENARLHLQESAFTNSKLDKSKISMELWQSVGLVWVKRGKGGKFMSWKTY